MRLVGMDWDNLVQAEMANKARPWLRELEDLSAIKVPRSLR